MTLSRYDENWKVMINLSSGICYPVSVVANGEKGLGECRLIATSMAMVDIRWLCERATNDVLQSDGEKEQRNATNKGGIRTRGICKSKPALVSTREKSRPQVEVTKRVLKLT